MAISRPPPRAKPLAAAEELADVRSGNEGPPGTGEQEHPDFRVPAHLVENMLKLREHVVVQGVEFVRAVESNGRDTGILVKQNGFIDHNFSLVNNLFSTGRGPVPLN